MLIDGMRVLSLCHYLQGPAAAQYLADLGADVVKLEPPRGAFERHWSGGRSYVEGVSAFHLAVNRNKRSIAVDMKNAAARPVLDRLVDWADVVMENFRPGVMERNGMGYEALKARKPAVIYASASAYGPTGPAAERPGQDLLMQARTGLAAVTGSPARGPTVVGAAVIDQHGAALLAMGILAAYVRRLQTGVGTRVEASLFHAGIDLQIEAITKWLHKQTPPDVLARGPNVGSWYHDAPYGPYRCKDGLLVLSMNDPARLAEALDSDPLRALVGIDRFVERDRYAAAVAEEIAPRPLAELRKVLDAHAIWHEPIQTYDDLARDPQAGHNGVFGRIDVGRSEATLVNHPLRYDGAIPPMRKAPPALGADTRAVLGELGFTPSEVDGLVRSGAVLAAGES
jgi:crotonobetainyl-CoA:carnitine CoA-transferase CaiB-like acyl-CoA transferase